MTPTIIWLRGCVQGRPGRLLGQQQQVALDHSGGDVAELPAVVLDRRATVSRARPLLLALQSFAAHGLRDD